MENGKLIGFSYLEQRLGSSIQNNRVPHAQIIVGPEGSGKKSVARQYARALLCYKHNGSACGICEACKQTETSVHPDMIEILPKGKSVLVADIEAIQHEIAIKPWYHGYKVIIIHQAHTMQEAAQNKLLKTLEEPPANIVILLLCNSTSSLLSTVLSRCQVIELPRVPGALMTDYLERRYPEFSADSIRSVSYLSDGRVGAAVKLLESQTFIQYRKDSILLLKSLLIEKNIPVVMKAIKEERERFLPMLSFWQSILRDSIVTASGGAGIINIDLLQDIDKLTERYSISELIERLEHTQEAERRIQRNGIYTVVCDWLLIKMEG